MNFYSEMFNMKLPNGEGLFNTLEVKLACDECLKGDHPERCVHMTDEIPPWKSVAKFDMIKAIYGNKTDLLQRESMGLVTEDMQSVFKAKYIDVLYNSSGYSLTKEPSFVFCCCDPNVSKANTKQYTNFTNLTHTFITTGWWLIRHGPPLARDRI